MPTFMVERYLPGIAYDAFADSIARAAAAAAELTRQGVPVAYLGSTFVPEEESCFCRFQGRDIEAVREVNRLADVPFWRVVEAVFVEGRAEPPPGHPEEVRMHARLAEVAPHMLAEGSAPANQGPGTA